MSGFYQRMQEAWRAANSLLCVGLDPDPARIPAPLRGAREPLYRFNREIVDATVEFACAFKPQVAYYAAVGAEGELERTIAYIRERHPRIPVILDAKRGDIGATARMYAKEAFERYGADAVTVNPYLGGDTLQPFLDHREKGVVILCRTSNAGSGDFQALDCGGTTLAHTVARRAVEEWNGNRNVMLVAGATWPGEIAEIRRLVGDMPLLIPGIGAQGGDVEAVVRAGVTGDGAGLLINSSRGILYAGEGAGFAEAAAGAARELRDAINRHRGTRSRS